jgi:Putative auto-transporter adhesin, head GIN domain
MRTQLAIIAVSAFAVSAVCLGGAFALGGEAIGNAGFDFGGFDLPRCDTMGTPTATATTRTLPWEGNGDQAVVAFPADTRYQAGVGDQLVVKGDPAIISHVRVRNGVVGLDCRYESFFGHADRIDVTLPGKRIFRTFEVSGTGNMQLSGLSQPELALKVSGAGSITADARTKKTDLDVSGSGTVEAKGQTDQLHVDVSGAGKVRAGELATRDADLDVSGLGHIEVSPEGALNVDLSGAGTIYLKKEPKSIQSDISGAGRIVHPDGESQGRPHHRQRARANGPDLDAIIEQAATTGRQPDQDEIDAATAKLKARIRERVAAEIANASLGDNGR